MKGSSDNTYSSKRILKNTLYLYARQLFTLLVSLYTARVVLDVLGVDDYGLYNVIGGIVVLISLINNSMISATQRFLTFELGKSDDIQVSRTFSMSMTIHLIIGIIIIILGETIGIWYVNNYLVVPFGRENAAFWIYQFSLASILFNVIRSPYQASIISYEKMSYFAVISIVEVFLKLGIVFILPLSKFDKLIFYSSLVFITTVMMTFTDRLYCKQRFSTCKYFLYFDRIYFKQLTRYLGWNLLGACSTMGTQQAGNMIINRFVGVAVNAAYGTANQISAAVTSFVTSFQMAFTPQIVKLYAQGNKELMFKLMNRTALLSYYLLFVLVVPILFNIDFILSLWLKVVPPFTGDFCFWIFLGCFIDALQAPLWIAIGATGRNKEYQIWQSVLFLLNIPFAYVVLKHGIEPYWVLIVRFIIISFAAVLRIIHVRIQIKMPLFRYFREVICRIAIVSLICFVINKLVLNIYHIDNFLSFLIYYSFSALFTLAIIFAVGIDKTDRHYLFRILKITRYE